MNPRVFPAATGRVPPGAIGHGDACYLLYKNVNRDVAL